MAENNDIEVDITVSVDPTSRAKLQETADAIAKIVAPTKRHCAPEPHVMGESPIVMADHPDMPLVGVGKTADEAVSNYYAINNITDRFPRRAAFLAGEVNAHGTKVTE